MEIIETIPEYFLAVEELTSWGEGRVVMRNWDRRKAFTVLAETCTQFKRLFYVRSRTTTVASAKNFPELVGFFKVPRKSAYGLFIEYVYFFFSPRSRTRKNNPEPVSHPLQEIGSATTRSTLHISKGLPTGSSMLAYTLHNQKPHRDLRNQRSIQI